jgi:hypothetical protein
MSFGTNAPEGFVDTVSQLSATCNSKNKTYDIQSGYASSIFHGDPVCSVGGYLNVGADGSGAVTGVFIGAVYKDPNGITQWVNYWPANATTFSDPGSAHIIDDPYVEFSIQPGTSNAGTHTATVSRADLGRNANFVLGAGNTSSGKSTTYLDMVTVATTAALNCRILSLTPGFSTAAGLPYNNVLGNLYNNVNVIFNNHKYKGGTGTVGG